MSLRALYLLALIILSSLIITCCNGATVPRKEKVRVREDMGRSLVLEGKPREGLVHLLEAAKIDPSNPEIQHQLAIVYQKIDEYELSLKHFQKAIRLNPKFPEAYNNMGTLYSQMGEWDKAQECFEKAVQDVLYMTPHFAYHNIGSVYFHRQDYLKAIENYEKAIGLAPDYLAAYIDLAAALELINQPEKAIDTYRKAVSLTPRSWNIHMSLSRLYLKMGLRQEAIKELNHIISSDPRSTYAKEAATLLRSIQN